MVHILICIYIYIIHRYVHIYICIHRYIHTHKNVYTYIYIYIYIYIYTYVYTCTQIYKLFTTLGKVTRRLTFEKLQHQGVGVGAAPFSGLLHVTPDPYLRVLSDKQTFYSL